MNDNDPNKPIQRGLSLGDSILYAVIGITLTYFFFEPGKEAISSWLKAML